MDTRYRETGGLCWGESFWNAVNATWPFATLTATHGGLHISMRFIGLWNEEFDFAKSEVLGITKKKGLFPFISTGIVLAHQKAGYPRFILFWTFEYQRLKTELTRLGFEVADQ
jgi:hypothetical protein